MIKSIKGGADFNEFLAVIMLRQKTINIKLFCHLTGWP